MRFNDIIGKLIQEYDLPGQGIDMEAAASAGVEMVKADDEIADQLIHDAIWKRIKDAATKAKKQAETTDENSQPTLFNVRPRHAIDTEGRVVKRTEDLSRFEWKRIIQIRWDQVQADQAYLNELMKADAALSPIWDEHPDYTYGEAEAAYAASRVAAE